MEAFLHYIWAHRRYTELIPQGALAGARIEVLDPGVLNVHAGPDFFAAKVRIDDLLWVGAVEIHHASSEWHQHHHDTDPAYRSVILHVVEQDNRPVIFPSGEALPTCLLMVPEELRPEAAALLSAEAKLPCTDHLASVPEEERRMWLSCLSRSRLSRKVAAVRQLLERSEGDWAQTLYALFLRALGFGLNGDAMERLAFALPLHLLLKHRDQLPQVEALLLGSAGLLDYLPDEALREERQREYAFLAHKYGLTPLPQGTFRRARTRPTGLPEYRLLQLATLIVHAPLWGSVFPEMPSMGALMTLLRHPLPAHYCGGKWRGNGMLSEEAVAHIAINVLVPYREAWRAHYQRVGEQVGEELCLDKLPAEANHVTRLFAEAGLTARSAQESQALLQLHTDYCTPQRCHRCPFSISSSSGLNDPR